VFDWVPRWLRVLFGALVLALVVWLLVVPQFGQAEEALDAIAGVNVGFVVLAGVLVAGSVVAQASLTRVVLPAVQRPTLAGMVRIELASTAVSHTVPGGTAAGTALAYRLLTRAGVTGPAAGFALGVRGIGSAVVLNAILWAALVVSVPTRGFDARYAIAALVGAALLGLTGVLLIGLLRARDTTTRLVTRLVRPIPFVDHEGAPAVVKRLGDQLHDLVSDRRLAVQATTRAAVYWLSLAAALWILLYAFGWTGDPISVVVAFGIVNVLAAIPITPRGLGVLEAVLIPMLVGFGAPGYAATLGVIGWRLLSFWAPIPLGTISYVSIRIAEPDVPTTNRDAVARELAEAGATGRQTLGDWARRRGLRRPR